MAQNASNEKSESPATGLTTEAIAHPDSDSNSAATSLGGLHVRKDLAPEERAALRDDLRHIPVFADLADDQLAWLADRCELIHLESGEVFARPGDPVEYLVVLLEGEIWIQRGAGGDAPIFTISPGQISGLLPYSRLTKFPGVSRAVAPTRAARLHKDFFPEMLERIPQLRPRLVAIMSDRIRESMMLETQRDKLMALGKLSAGLAHELNNPAAAAQRAAATLREALEAVRDASIRLARHSLSDHQRESITHLEREAGKFAAPVPSDPLAQSDREDRITNWLEQNQVSEPWQIAGTLAESGVDVPQLDSLHIELGDVVLSDALRRIASLLTVIRLIGEIENSAKRISELVRSVKEYSYMDQAPIQEIDVHHGIESTLTILSHRLKKGVNVIREYEPTLPRISAYGGELNQVWTNIIDNAIDAMNGKGELHIRTKRKLDHVAIEIQDNGPGIPPDVLPHIYDPFFTTKGIGEGTGLGLDTACRIIRKHHGEIHAHSQPGNTCFEVILPIRQPNEPKKTEDGRENVGAGNSR